MVNATLPPLTPPKSTPAAILTEDGLKRYFVVHGGLFSKDDVTLEDIRKVPRLGRQPGQEGLMCKSLEICVRFSCVGTFIDFCLYWIR